MIYYIIWVVSIILTYTFRVVYNTLSKNITTCTTGFIAHDDAVEYYYHPNLNYKFSEHYYTSIGRKPKLVSVLQILFLSIIPIFGAMWEFFGMCSAIYTCLVYYVGYKNEVDKCYLN